jgi:pyruvate dehydrogenase E1 component
MTNHNQTPFSIEKTDWLDALEEVLLSESPENIAELFSDLRRLAARKGVVFKGNALNTPFFNTIPTAIEPIYNGEYVLEQKLENLIRWNALAMVLQANDRDGTLGGHLSTYAGAATMLEVGFNHFFQNKTTDYGGDLLFIQGHSSPGVYARAFLEGRLSAVQLSHFRQELQDGGGLPSYPHPRRLPQFWQAPSVSMGLGPLMAIQQARFAKYLENRGLKPQNGGKIWCFIGDGEMSEPEIMGSVAIAAREKLDNLIFVIHVNLVRLDGPIDANGKIIQTFERQFLGADWDVIKVVFGSEWDDLFQKDTEGKLLACLESLKDGDFQYISTLRAQGKAAEIRQIIAQGDPSVLTLLSTFSDEEILKLKYGGNDRFKVYEAYNQAVDHKNPTVILMHTVKGYGLGSLVEGKNTAHQTKKMDAKTRLALARKYQIPLSDEAAERADFYMPPSDSPEIQYLHRRRYALGGYFPERQFENRPLSMPPEKTFQNIGIGTPSTTQCFVRLLKNLLADAQIGRFIVPITPDESQTFGLHTLFEKSGIYNPEGQQYHLLDDDAAKYVERKNGQILQEGINEAGALATFAAAGSAYAVHGIPTVPFYIFYSIFGFQRVADLIYAAADMLCKGFLMGATAGRTTLNGEGLQHQDGHSPLLAATIPSVVTYDPAFDFELAAIVKSGLQRMFVADEKVIFYVMLYNESYKMPRLSSEMAQNDADTEGVDELKIKNSELKMTRNMLNGLYCFKQSSLPVVKYQKVHLFGSGSIMQQVLAAADMLEQMNISTDVWSATSYVELTRNCTVIERRNLLKINDKMIEKSHFEQLFAEEQGIIVATSDYMKALPNGIAKWSPLDFTALGTDGFGLSESRVALRDWFEISPKFIVLTALNRLATQGKLDWSVVADFMEKQNISATKIDATSI